MRSSRCAISSPVNREFQGNLAVAMNGAMAVNSELLGVDVGGVLVDRIRADGSDTSFFSDRFLETPAVAGAFETLTRLGRERFGQRICIVSKCGPRTEEKTRLWLAHHKLLDVLGLDLRADLLFISCQCDGCREAAPGLDARP